MPYFNSYAMCEARTLLVERLRSACRHGLSFLAKVQMEAGQAILGFESGKCERDVSVQVKPPMKVNKVCCETMTWVLDGLSTV